jgi:hypothetical protein
MGYDFDKDDFTSIPVEIDEFIDNEYYLCKQFNEILSASHKDILKNIYINPLINNYSNIILLSTTDKDKSTKNVNKIAIATIGMLYDLYRISLLKNIELKLNVLESSKLYFIIYNPQLSSISNNDVMSIYKVLVYIIKKAKYFNDYFNANVDNSLVISNVRKPRDIYGLNIINAIIEFDINDDCFMDGYNTIKRRMMSKFMNTNNFMPCKLWTILSEMTQEDIPKNILKLQYGDPYMNYMNTKIITME